MTKQKPKRKKPATSDVLVRKIPAETLRELEELATERGVSRTVLLREAIEQGALVLLSGTRAR